VIIVIEGGIMVKMRVGRGYEGKKGKIFRENRAGNC